MISTPTQRVCFLLAMLALVGLHRAAEASTLQIMGETVIMDIIEESSPTGDPLPLFGVPTAAGDNFDFNPTGDFSAMSMDGGPTDSTDGKLSFMIYAKDNYGIESFGIFEEGVVTLLDAFGNGNAFASVSGIVNVDINEINGVPISPIELPQSMMIFSPYDGIYLHSDLAVGPQFQTGWSGGIEVDIAGAAAEYGYEGKVTKITVSLDNILLAATEGSGTSALIDKKDFDVFVDTRPMEVPEPSTLCLLGLGFCGGGSVALRRRWG